MCEVAWVSHDCIQPARHKFRRGVVRAFGKVSLQLGHGLEPNPDRDNPDKRRESREHNVGDRCGYRQRGQNQRDKMLPRKPAAQLHGAEEEGMGASEGEPDHPDLGLEEVLPPKISLTADCIDEQQGQLTY
eukprot:CAMPEP_0117480520 /NCGR_PEP_ID=MMETSP0784-20121206/12432_1 /TAXON_ID=39447 /ORGANISM="" /LENGTH=130 /DNA_ID=CAMNT_0005274959 /DNA_START=157 /DNA_END=549 /DNA_ORIENTATION=-